jgi:2-polyprenyl-3-methyl-5-hydroxy-6-metoxy-1,4-benzoquinol methylase
MDFINKTSYTREEDLKRLKFIQSAIVGLKNPKAKVLDVGCGNGNSSRQIASLGFEVIGIDISDKTIEAANELNPYPNLRFENIAAEELDLNDKFDVIICSEVVEHINEPAPVIKSLKKLLKIDGILIVTVPNGYGPREAIMTKPMQAAMNNESLWKMVVNTKKLFGYKGGTIQSEAEDLTHVQFFTKSSLLELFKEQEMELETFGVTNFIESVFPFSIIANRVQMVQKFDSWLADMLPSFLASGFMTIWKHKK